MADNYSQLTGELKLKKITPVIRALFGAYCVEQGEEGKAHIEKGRHNRISYSDVARTISSVFRLAIDREGVFNDAIKELALHLDPAKYDAIVTIIGDGGIDDCEEADLATLLSFAEILNDGHDLKCLSLETAFTCDKMIPGQFGGLGEYVGKHFSMRSSSSTALFYGENIDTAIAEEYIEKATQFATGYVTAFLNGIEDKNIRAEIAQQLADRLHEQFKPIYAPKM